jgi:hypothetical protein
VVSGGQDKTLKLWDATTGVLVQTFDGHSAAVLSVAFSPDGSRLLSGSSDNTLKLWDAQEGTLVRTLRGHTDAVLSVGFSPDGTRLLSGSSDNTLKLWDVATGRLLKTFAGHSAPITSTVFSPDGFKALSGSADSSITIWDVNRGEGLVSMIASPRGEWLAITPAGFFLASPGGAEMLSIVRGLNEVLSGDQVRDHLYRPDLVAEVLRGDPLGNYDFEARMLNLESLLDSGPPPKIELLSADRGSDTIQVAVRIVDTGGGIGRMIWRVNAETKSLTKPIDGPSYAGRYVVIHETLTVNPQIPNEIEITAYNGRNLSAARPVHTTIEALGMQTEERQRPRMFVLAVAIDNYRDQRYRIRYAVSDAQTIAQALTVVGHNLFASVQTTILTDDRFTEVGIAAEFSRIAAEAKAGDVFILFLSGHSQSIGGKYYYLPQTFDVTEIDMAEKHAIGTDKWQAWLARIASQKILAIVDTSQSATLVDLNLTAGAATDHFQRATGVNLISASSEAFEGYEGHGLLTYALLEALQRKDDTQPITVAGLARYVDKRAPEITQQLSGIYQRPVIKLSGADFAIGVAGSALKADAEQAISKTPSHALIRTAYVREKPAMDANVTLQLWPGSQVRVVELVGYWALIAREGEKLGYLRSDALVRLQEDTSEKAIKVRRDVMKESICDLTIKEYEALVCESQPQCSPDCRALGAQLLSCAFSRQPRCAQ